MPDTTATMPAAAKALFMNSYWNMSMKVMIVAVMVVNMAMVVRMFDAFHVVAPRHHENMSLGTHHADIGSEKSRQYRRCDDFVDGAEHRLAVAEIEHAVERAEQLVELVRAEQDSDLALAADPAHHVDRDLLMARVEADQRLVE